MRVAVGDVRLSFEVYGEQRVLTEEGLRSRPVVIGLHGGPGSDGTRLRYQLASLADVAQIIVPDQRGHGLSDRATAETWNLSAWARDVRGLSDALGIDHPVVLGASFGGFVAQQYAATYPGHPAALILVSTGPRFASFDEYIARFREVGGEEAAEVARRDWEEPSEESSVEWSRVCGPLLSLSADRDSRSARANAAQIATPEVNLHFMANEGMKMDLRSVLPRVRCPTLVIVG